MNSSRLFPLLSVGVVLLWTHALRADPAPQPDPAPAKDSPTPSPLPSLDELLGTTPSPTNQPADQAADQAASSSAPDNAELSRRLSAEEMGDAFEQAITLMGDAAQRMEHRDLSLDTQRLQEDVLRKLDELISQIQQQQKQQSSSSSSSSSSSQQQDNADNTQGQNRQRPKPAQQSQQSQNQPGNADSQNQPGQPQSPASQSGALRPALESASAQWGSLPQRTRDALQQGAADKFSATWEQATENYYRRLAEEAAKRR